MPSLNLKSKTNRNLLIHIFSSYLIKGLGILCSIIAMPLYLKYFHDQLILGIWFTLLSVLNWILVFDMGIGNGLRNHLTKALANRETISAKKLISSAYVTLGIWTLIITICSCSIAFIIDWNSFLNISQDQLPANVLLHSIIICLLGVLFSFFLRIITSIIYALQRSAITNLISFTSQFLILIYLVLAPKQDPTRALLSMSYVYALCSNIPLLGATICIFCEKKLTAIRPHYKCFERDSAKKVLSMGILFLALQILYMVISVTDSWFITKFYDPAFSVNYQIYYKPFSFIGMLFMLALTPLWSAITKAYAEKRFSWILKLQRVLYISFAAVSTFQILFLLIMPWIFKIWLGSENLGFNYFSGVCFTAYSTIFIWIAIQSTLVAGLGKLKVQLNCYILAVIIKVGLIVFLHKIFTQWEFVVIATSVALIPYCIAQPIFLRKDLQTLSD